MMALIFNRIGRLPFVCSAGIIVLFHFIIFFTAPVCFVVFERSSFFEAIASLSASMASSFRWNECASFYGFFDSFRMNERLCMCRLDSGRLMWIFALERELRMLMLLGQVR